MIRVVHDLFWFGLTGGLATAQVAVGGGGAIDDGIPGPGTWEWNPPAPPVSLPNPELSAPISIPVAVTSIQSLTIEGLEHSWIGDLTLTLIAPDTEEYLIFVRPGFSPAAPGGASAEFGDGEYAFVDVGGAPLPDNTTGGTLSFGCYLVDDDTGSAVWNDGDLGIRVRPLSQINAPPGDWQLAFYDALEGIDFGSYTGWRLNFNGDGTSTCASVALSLCNGDGSVLGCTPCPCDNDAPSGTLGGCLNSSNTSGRLFAHGSASVSAPDPEDLAFLGTGMTPLSFAVLVSGDAVAPQNPQNPCFGEDSGVQSIALDGLRCAVGNVLRHGGRPVSAAGHVGDRSQSALGLGVDGWGGATGAQAIVALAGFVPGQTRFFQAFYRELPGTSCLTEQNTSQALQLTFQP